MARGHRHLGAKYRRQCRKEKNLHDIRKPKPQPVVIVAEQTEVVEPEPTQSPAQRAFVSID